MDSPIIAKKKANLLHLSIFDHSEKYRKVSRSVDSATHLHPRHTHTVRSTNRELDAENAHEAIDLH